MDYRDREAIEGLFVRLREVEGRIPRDREAEALIKQKIAEHPSSTYYMAQTIIVQQQALEQAEQRIAALEGGRRGRDRQRGGGWGQQQGWGGPWGGAPGYGGGGFLAGAAQTALGVAGGVLLGSLIGGAFAGDAEAAEADQGDSDQDGGDSGGEDFGGGGDDFGGGGDF
jgi:hypothetical protein